MKMKFISSVMIGLMFLSCGSRELSRADAEKASPAPEPYPTQGIMHFMYGEIYRSGGNYAYANMEYQRALDYDTSTTILNAIAESYLAMGKKELARDYFEKTLYFDPEDPTANSSIINIYMSEGRFDKAIPVLEKELGKNPEDTGLLRKLAEAYRRSSKYRQALETLERLMRLEPDIPWSYIYAAEIQLENDRIADAAPYLEKAVSLLPPDNELYEFWVRALVEKNDVPALLKALESWMAADPGILLPYLFYAEQQIRMDNIAAADSALSWVRRQRDEDYRIPFLDGTLSMMKCNADSVWHYYIETATFPEADRNVFMRFGLWFWERGDLERAVQIADSAIDRFGREPRWLHMLAMLYHGKGSSGNAIVLLQEVISADPQNRGAREDLANIFLQEGNASAADSIYAGLIQETPEDPSLLNNYAYALAQMRLRLDTAMGMVNKALEKEENAAYCDTKAWIYYQRGKYRPALRWIKKSMKYKDAGSEVHYHHGRIRMALGQEGAARTAFEAALNINPQNIEALEALEELAI